MKILICGSRGIPAQYGGFESLAEALAINLNARDNRVTVSGFRAELKRELSKEVHGVISYQVPAIGPRFVQNLLSTWKSTRDLDAKDDFDFVIVLNDVNYFVALKYMKKGIRTVLHLDGAEARRSGLPMIGKLAHWFFRQLAIRSQIPLVVDSSSIRDQLSQARKDVKVIAYAPHLAKAKKPNLSNLGIPDQDFYLVIARFVEENQLLEAIEAYRESNLNETLVIVGLGTGTKKYERQVLEAARECEGVRVLPKNYNRGEINWLLQNAKAYIHGHSVGGTNPILVDARAHSRLIFSHNNQYNRENSGKKESHWDSVEELTELINTADSRVIPKDMMFNYDFETWDGITKQYMEMYDQRLSSEK